MTYKKSSIIISIVIIMLCLSSCGVYKKYQSSMPAVSNDTIIPHWREVFTDPYLQAMIDSTLRNNSDIKTARINIREAEISFKTSRLGYLPTFFAGSPTSKVITGGVSKTGSAASEVTYDLGISGSWQLDIFGGTITNTKRQKKAQLEYEKDYEQAVECQLISSVAQLYYQLLGEQRQLDIQKDMLKLYEKTYESTQSLFKAGQYTIVGVKEAQAHLENLKFSIIQLEYDIEETKKALCKLMNEVPHDIKYGSIDDITMPDLMKTGVTPEMLSNRPDVRAAEKQMEIAYYDMQLSRGALYPSITITANGGWMNPATWFITGLGSLAQPIFQGGKLRADLKISKLEQEKALVTFRQTVLDATHEVSTAMDECKLAADQSIPLHIEVEALTRSVYANQELMNKGQATYLEVLTSMQNLLSAKTSEVNNKSGAAQAIVKFYGALGGR